MYSDGIVIYFLRVGTHEFSPLGQFFFGKVRDFCFLVEIQEKKTATFFGKSANSAT
jgi:hypothetical protein